MRVIFSLLQQSSKSESTNTFDYVISVFEPTILFILLKRLV
jgi:hypothetical protein